MITRKLIVDLRSYWHVGSGRSAGYHLDATVDRDAQGLPYIPGRMLKGLLRDAVRRLAHWGHIPQADAVNHLFGNDGSHAIGLVRDATTPGVLGVSNAALPAEVACWLASTEEGRKYREALFQATFATAIDETTGSAKAQSLRGTEVSVPLALHAELTLPDSDADTGFATLSEALPLITAVGGHRTRGLGRAHLFLEAAR